MMCKAEEKFLIDVFCSHNSQDMPHETGTDLWETETLARLTRSPMTATASDRSGARHSANFSAYKSSRPSYESSYPPFSQHCQTYHHHHQRHHEETETHPLYYNEFPNSPHHHSSNYWSTTPAPSFFVPPPPLSYASTRSPPSVVYVQPKTPASKKCNLVFDVEPNDVLCGRGAPTTWHPGNQNFRKLISKFQSHYLAARRIDKPEIAMKIVELVRERGGRFLKRTKVTGVGPRGRGHFCWEEIGEQRAYEKACQALREGAPELRRQFAAKELASLNDHDPRSQRYNEIDDCARSSVTPV